MASTSTTTDLRKPTILDLLKNLIDTTDCPPSDAPAVRSELLKTLNRIKQSDDPTTHKEELEQWRMATCYASNGLHRKFYAFTDLEWRLKEVPDNFGQSVDDILGDGGLSLRLENHRVGSLDELLKKMTVEEIAEEIVKVVAARGRICEVS